MPRLRIVAVIVLILAAATLIAWGVAQGTPPFQARRLLAHSRALAAQGNLAAASAKLDLLLQRFPTSGSADDALLVRGHLAAQTGDWLTAQAAFQRLVQEFPMSTLAVEAQAALGEANLQLLFSPALTPQDRLYVVQPGDTLAAIARRFRMTVELLKQSNRLGEDVIRPGQRLKIASGTWTILVDKSQNTLLLKRDEDIVKQYLVSTGSDNSTPVGTFTIVNRLINPPWYSEKGIIAFGDPRNILGTRWLGFDKPGYGIHGTTDSSTIGTQVTAGCVRLRNADVEELYTIVPEGTQVTIID